ncbi:MAG TPA: HAD hydrolase-like protein [Nitrososphaerales archaeon]|nr:HAD hydrolase-like protein [Nitrososphaerales archaeon]HUK75930.1 HAD hydrolase-like protein [Nitrososphaerales archaeon]
MEREGSVNAGSYRSFVFDLDRTLVTIPIDWVSVRKEVERISGVTLDRTLMFLQLREILRRRPELRGPLFSTIDSFELKAASGTKPMDGALELLGVLAGRAKVALVTLQGRPVCDEIARTLKMDGFFGARITREDSLDRGEQIQMAVRAIRSSPELTLFVGDMENDVIGARRARVEVAIMGNRPLGDQRPDHRFQNFAELRSFLT